MSKGSRFLRIVVHIRLWPCVSPVIYTLFLTSFIGKCDKHTPWRYKSPETDKSISQTFLRYSSFSWKYFSLSICNHLLSYRSKDHSLSISFFSSTCPSCFHLSYNHIFGNLSNISATELLPPSLSTRDSNVRRTIYLQIQILYPLKPRLRRHVHVTKLKQTISFTFPASHWWSIISTWVPHDLIILLSYLSHRIQPLTVYLSLHQSLPQHLLFPVSPLLSPWMDESLSKILQRFLKDFVYPCFPVQIFFLKNLCRIFVREGLAQVKLSPVNRQIALSSSQNLLRIQVHHLFSLVYVLLMWDLHLLLELFKLVLLRWVWVIQKVPYILLITVSEAP